MDLKGTDISPNLDAAIAREVGLRLRASPDAVAKLLASPLIANGIPGLSSSQNRDTAYYDTTDLRLQKRGVCLRVRRRGDRFIQTITAPGSTAGAHGRQKWETTIPDLTPHPDWVMDHGGRAQLGHLAAGELTAVCQTRIQRESRVIGYRYDDAIALIEIAFDRGTLEAGEQSLPTAEIELELLKGSRHALFSLALELHDTAPLHVEIRSRAERAYALFTGRPPRWQKAKKLRFAADATVDYGIAAIFENCLNHWLANEPAVLESDDAEALHQMRVGLRRMRSALNLFGSILPVMQTVWLQKECEWVANALGAARNWDAFLDDVLAPLEAKRPGDKSLAALRQQCQRARARNYETARDAIGSPRYTAFVLNFSRWLADSGWHATHNTTRSEILAAPLKAFADTILEQQHRKIMKQGRHLASATPEKRHKFRIAVKKMRYASDFFTSLYRGKKSRAMIKDLSRLQATLGDLNDLAVTERQLETVIYQAFAHPAHDDIIKAMGVVVGWCTARTRRDETKLFELWTRYSRHKRYWKRARKKK